MICLTHIPKTGGTTFRHILINNYSWRHIDFPGSKKIIIKPTNFHFNSFIIKLSKVAIKQLNFNINKTQRVARASLQYWQLVVILFLFIQGIKKL